MIKTRRREITRSKKLADFLSDLRLKNDFTLLDVQERSKSYREKVNFDYLSRVERGLLLPSLPKLLTLARVYRISPSVFFDLIEIGECEKIKPDIHDYEECKAYAINCADHGNIDKAIGAFGRCVEIVRGDKNLKNKEEKLSDIYLCSAIALRLKGKLTLAKEDLERAIQNRKISPPLKMRILNEFANIYLEQDNIALAENFADAALRLAKEKKDAVTIGTAYCTKANVLRRFGAYEECKFHLRRALGLFEATKNTPNLVSAYINLGDCLVKMNQPEQALRVLEKGKLLTEKERLMRQHGMILVNIGDAYRHLQMFDKAKFFLMEANRISREHEYAKSAFYANFYLWKIAIEEKDKFSEKECLMSLKFYRTKIQEMFDEVREFDAHLNSTK